MNHGIQPGHADGKIGQRAGHGQGHIDAQQIERDVGGPRHDLAQRIKALCPEELHAPHPHHGQEDHRDERDAQPPQPVEHAPPQVDARRQLIQSHQHGRPGGGDSRHSLEIGVDET